MKEKKRMMEENEVANKRDFLKVIGAGLGVAGLSSIMGAQTFADVDKNGKYVILITHGGNDPNRVKFGRRRLAHVEYAGLLGPLDLIVGGES